MRFRLKLLINYFFPAGRDAVGFIALDPPLGGRGVSDLFIEAVDAPFPFKIWEPG